MNGMNGEKMARKGRSPYNDKQEGKIRWLWDANLNRSPKGILLSITE